MKQTEISFFFARAKKILISNLVKFVILVVIACIFATITSYCWGKPIIVLPLLPVCICFHHILILMFKIHRNVKDYRTLYDLNEYASSLDAQTMETPEE